MFVLALLRNVNKLPQIKCLKRFPTVNSLILNKNFSMTKTLKHEQRDYSEASRKRKLGSVIWYSTSAIVLMVGLTYAAVPLYKMFCEAQGIDVSSKVSNSSDEELKKRLSNLKREDRVIKVKFLANKSSDLLWNFEPQQKEINLPIGETSLAFYKAKNLTQRPITGIATYNILPFEAGLYFNKIQCFCFEEQRLEPNEEVDMPVFFYLDDQYARDPLLENVDTICLSYTFFESKGAVNLENELPNLPKKFLQ